MKERKVFYAGVLVVAFLVAFSIVSINTKASTIYVDPSDANAYTTIQAAINAASDEDTVIVNASATPYKEHVIVNKSIILQANGKVIINGTINITADGVKVIGFTIVPGKVSGDFAGIKIAASNVVIGKNTVCDMTGDGNGTIKGIHVYWGSNTSCIKNITIIHNHILSINNTQNSSGGYGGADGIMIQGNITNVTIEDNLIEDIHSAGWAFGVEITPTNVSDTLPPMNVTVIKNTIRGINDGSIYDVWNTSSGNPYFNAPYPGVCVIVEESYLVSANASGIEIHYNNFVDTSVHPTYPIVGVVNKDTNHILNATLNWWDDKSGPYDLYGSVETPPWTSNPLNESNTDGGGCAVSNYTDYTPWLYSEWKFGLVCNVDNTTYPIYYGSIQAAVDDAGINETIKVYPGVYKEKIILNKSLKLKGDPIINGNGSVGIKIEANYTLIENFTIINCSRGIYAVASYTLHNITINNCTIYNCTWAPGYGIHFDGVINSTINDTEINDTTHGIYLSSTNYTEILNCVLHHNSENGIYILSSSDNNTIYKCLIHNNTGAGIYVFGGRDNHINKSAIRDNSNHGIYLWSAVNNSIINSRICDNSPYGIYIFSASTANTIYNNTFSGSSGWDVFVSGSNDNTFINNTFSSYPTKASFSYNGDFSVKGVTNPPAMPTGVENISKFLNISLTGTWINVTFYYEDTDLADPIHETYMRVWRYTTTWQREGWFSWQGINETKNEISVNITSAGSIFAPLQSMLH